ncbi:MAG: cytochrome c maturation protein CcmE [Gammaproteobacteria bacterium]|nr:cytochrome c maturation protein CcmE [Gammaproteobacteria bacterium]
MNPKRKNRLILVLLILGGTGLAVALGTMALKENIQYYLSPLEVKQGKAPANHSFRLAGLVAAGSVKRETNGLTTHFDITDNAETITVTYTGILPDLFREGQGIVATGKLKTPSTFIAEEVLAKHDETYMPPPVQDALDKAKMSTEASAKAAQHSGASSK